MTDRFADEVSQTAALQRRAEDLRRAVREMLQRIATANATNEGCIPSVFAQYFERAAQNIAQLELSSDEGLERLRAQSREMEDVTRACFTCFKMAGQHRSTPADEDVHFNLSDFENVVRFERPS